MKRIGLALLTVAVAFSFMSCARDSGSVFYRVWKHVEWHILGAYQDFVELHKAIDRYAFNLDERNPDRY